MDLYVTGDRNDIMLSQRSSNSYSGHDMDVNVYSDDNDIHVIQEHNSSKDLTLTLNNDDNNVITLRITMRLNTTNNNNNNNNNNNKNNNDDYTNNSNNNK